MPKRDTKVGMISKEEAKPYIGRPTGCTHTSTPLLSGAKDVDRAKEIVRQILANGKNKHRYGIDMNEKNLNFAATRCFCQYTFEQFERPVCLICLGYAGAEARFAYYCKFGANCASDTCRKCHGEHCAQCYKPRCRNCYVSKDGSLVQCVWQSNDAKCSLCHKYVYDMFGAKSDQKSIHSRVECKMGPECNTINCTRVHGPITFMMRTSAVKKILTHADNPSDQEPEKVPMAQSSTLPPPIMPIMAPMSPPTVSIVSQSTLPPPSEEEKSPIEVPNEPLGPVEMLVKNSLYTSPSIAFPVMQPTSMIQNWPAFAKESLGEHPIHTINATLIGGHKIVIENGSSSLTLTIDPKRCVINIYK